MNPTIDAEPGNVGIAQRERTLEASLWTREKSWIRWRKEKWVGWQIWSIIIYYKLRMTSALVCVLVCHSLSACNLWNIFICKSGLVLSPSMIIKLYKTSPLFSHTTIIINIPCVRLPHIMAIPFQGQYLWWCQPQQQRYPPVQVY